MSKNDYATSFTVDQSPEQAFDRINNVRGWWWGEVEGDTDKLNTEFTYKVPGIHFSKQKITKLVPGKKIVWHITDANLSFADNKEEWIGTEIIFDISKKDNKTEVRFTHAGLVPQFECFDRCSNAWTMLINKNLKNYIMTGEDQPAPW